MLNELSFYLLAALILAGAVAAMTLRNLVHCALCAAGAFAGLAGIYLQLGAEFVGLAQILVYVGAVAILIVFTVLLTNGGDMQRGRPRFSISGLAGLAAAALVFACIAGPIHRSPGLRIHAATGVTSRVEKIGEELMTHCVLPLEATGLLLTAALLGAAVIAMSEQPKARRANQSKTAQRPVLEKVTLP